jgi:Spy/CpxP family protein refolding chaperone
MKTSKLLPTINLATPLRMMSLAVLLAVGASAAQTANAQPNDMRGGADYRHGQRGAAEMGPGMGQGMGHGMDHGMGSGNPRMMGRMLDAVNASAEQRAQIKQITDAARADMKARYDAGRQLRADSAALFAQPTVDARAAEALRQQMLAQHDEASKRQLQTMLDISRVLTPEQRKTLAERMTQRRSMMERQRAERLSADTAPAR